MWLDDMFHSSCEEGVDVAGGVAAFVQDLFCRQGKNFCPVCHVFSFPEVSLPPFAESPSLIMEISILTRASPSPNQDSYNARVSLT